MEEEHRSKQMDLVAAGTGQINACFYYGHRTSLCCQSNHARDSGTIQLCSVDVISLDFLGH